MGDISLKISLPQEIITLRKSKLFDKKNKGDISKNLYEFFKERFKSELNQRNRILNKFNESKINENLLLTTQKQTIKKKLRLSKITTEGEERTCCFEFCDHKSQREIKLFSKNFLNEKKPVKLIRLDEEKSFKIENDKIKSWLVFVKLITLLGKLGKVLTKNNKDLKDKNGNTQLITKKKMFLVSNIYETPRNMIFTRAGMYANLKMDSFQNESLILTRILLLKILENKKLKKRISNFGEKCFLKREFN